MKYISKNGRRDQALKENWDEEAEQTVKAAVKTKRQRKAAKAKESPDPLINAEEPIVELPPTRAKRFRRVIEPSVPEVVEKPLKKKAQSTTLIIPKLNLQVIRVRIVGDTPLLCHRWSEKAMNMILDKQMKRPAKGREAKDPQRDFEESLYRCPNGKCGFPALAFKTAAVDACTSVSGITKVMARQAFHVRGDLVEIEGEPRMHQGMVRIAMQTADIRFRGEFPEWACWLEIEYNASVMSAEQITGLIELAGFAVGVGEHRSERGGRYGRFHVE